jgi:soluble P-type ATPase
MITIDIPGLLPLQAKHLVLDFNGTLAIDGKLINGVGQLLELLNSQLDIYILTADTFGTVKNEISGLNCKLEILNRNNRICRRRNMCLIWEKKV